jgi:phenylacetate-coenzyme A ligase PaaK-like adenylate-forming protein
MSNFISNLINSELDELSFKKLAFEAFSFQYENNIVYRQFVNYLKKNLSNINEIEDIPFLPVQFFKKNMVSCSEKHDIIFTSSGTSGMEESKHFVKDISIYKKSFEKGFEYFFGNVEDYCILALLPSYLERSGSSLVYMMDELIKKSKHPLSSFHLHDKENLIIILEELKNKKQKTLLLGVTYALLDLAELNIELNENFLVMETGGMKGKRKEMIKEELHEQLKNKFKINQVFSEYGMTELLSQAYSKYRGIFETPPWMKIVIKEVTDPNKVCDLNKSGIVNVIDLANWYSCPFIATQDLGKKIDEKYFELLGRIDNSDIRGCNLLVA